MVASETNITYATLIYIPRKKRKIFLGLLIGVYDRCLKWAYVGALDSNEPLEHMPEIRTEVISSSRYPIDKDSLLVSYCIWRILFKKVLKAQLPLPRAQKIIPVIVTRWNFCKGRIDEMTRHLDRMQFDFTRATPKQNLILREFRKMSISVLFVKKHCFPMTDVPRKQGYSKIQKHLSHLGQAYSLKGVLHKLATSYKINNPIAGAHPVMLDGGHLKDANSKGDEQSNEANQCGLRSWQKEAREYVESFFTGKRNRFMHWCKNDRLQKIRLDTTLNHSHRSIGSILKVSHHEEQEKQKKKLKSAPRCLLCVATIGNKMAHQSYYQCFICGVHLCIITHGRNKLSCFERWQNTKNLISLKKNRNVTPSVPTRTSPRKKARKDTSNLALRTENVSSLSARRKSPRFVFEDGTKGESV